MIEVQKVLFIAAQSEEVKPAGEYQEINKIATDRFKVEYFPVGKTEDIYTGILSENTQIVHFCGHGLPNGNFFFELEGKGKGREVKPHELEGGFKDVKGISCVVLNFCYSAEAAQLISQHIDYVIGIKGDIDREHAIAFSQGFYRVLKSNNVFDSGVFQKAAGAGWNALSIMGSQEVLVTYPDVITPTSKPEVQLLEPAERSTVPMKSTFKGTYKNLPEGSSIWVYINAPKAHKYYLDPIAVAGNKRDGTWTRSGVILGGEADSGEEFIVGVLIADEEATKTLRTKEDDLDELPPGVQRKNEYVIVRE